MELKVNKKSYSFKFGVKFVREIDKAMPITADGIDFGLGLSAKLLPELNAGNINSLSRALYLANRTEKEKLTQDEIDDFIDDTEDIEALFDEVLKDLSESNAGKLSARNLNKALKQQNKKDQK